MQVMEIVEGRMSGDLARVPSLATVKVVSSFGRVHGTARMWLLVARNSYRVHPSSATRQLLR